MSELQVMFPLHLLKFLVLSRWPSRTSQQKGHKTGRHVVLGAKSLHQATLPIQMGCLQQSSQPAEDHRPQPKILTVEHAQKKTVSEKNHLYRAESEKSTCLLMWSLRDPLIQGNWKRLQYKDVPGINQLKSLLHPTKRYKSLCNSPL